MPSFRQVYETADAKRVQREPPTFVKRAYSASVRCAASLMDPVMDMIEFAARVRALKAQTLAFDEDKDANAKLKILHYGTDITLFSDVTHVDTKGGRGDKREVFQTGVYPSAGDLASYRLV